MYFHIILTEKCNSQCRYCYEKSMKEFDNSLGDKFEFDFSAPCEFNVDIKKLRGFVEKDENPVLIFYGGEPLLKIDLIKEIMEGLGNEVRFCMQTNGKLLDMLEKKYLEKFSKILVSLDGSEERTDFNRGNGTYVKVIENLKKIKEIRNCEIVARMTISFPDIFKQVQHLVWLIDRGLIDSIHWQLDAGFYKNDFSKDFEKFVKEYNSQLKKLIDFWVEEMKKGQMLKLYPFLGIFEALYYGKKTKLRCGSGHAGYTITTNGIITCCPIMNNIKDFYVGDLDSNPKNLKKINIGGKCLGCDYLNLCGGRCLYSNKAELWPSEGQDLICRTVKCLIDGINGKMGKINKLINEGIVKEKSFEYEKYFGPEIIP